MRIDRAGQKDLPAVMQVISLCTQHMQANAIYQWDELYPDIQVVKKDIRDRSLFVIREDGFCVACVSLNAIRPDEYRLVKWRCATGRALVIHRLCVHPQWQGRGLGTRLMDFAEKFAVERSFPCIRLDAYTGNPRALALYERRAYQRVGQVYFPRRDLPFDCFEKALLKRPAA